MTDDEINRAIAEACGYTFDGDKWQRGGVRIMWQHYNRELGYSDPPDYCNDLNAMHEAEQSLWDRDWSLRHEFVNHLARILNPVHGYRMQEAIDLLDATARQRAEAFLRTLGKWEEDA